MSELVSETPINPDWKLTISLNFFALIPSVRARYQTRPGSRSPERVLIGTPAVGVSIEIIVAVGCGCAQGFLKRDPLHTLQAALQKLVCLGFDPTGDDVLPPTAVWRVILKPAVMGRIVRRRDHDSIGESGLASAVVPENSERNSRCWGIFVPFRQHDFNSVSSQHFQRAGKSRHR
jgi:hypothetical protein